jgi:hypothetical protein
MPAKQERVEQAVKPCELILGAIDKHLAAAVTCTLPEEDRKRRKQAFVEELKSRPEITNEVLLNFIRAVTLKGLPIVDPMQHVSPHRPAQAISTEMLNFD